MNSHAKCKQASVFFQGVEMLRARIRRRIPIRRRETHQHRIALLHLSAGDYSVSNQKTARVVRGWIVSKDFLDDIAKKLRVVLDALAQLAMSRQSKQRITDQTRRGFVSLRQETDAIPND